MCAAKEALRSSVSGRSHTNNFTLVSAVICVKHNISGLLISVSVYVHHHWWYGCFRPQLFRTGSVDGGVKAELLLLNWYNFFQTLGSLGHCPASPSGRITKHCMARNRWNKNPKLPSLLVQIFDEMKWNAALLSPAKRNPRVAQPRIHAVFRFGGLCQGCTAWWLTFLQRMRGYEG